MQKKVWVFVGIIAAVSLVAGMTLASPSSSGTANKPWGVKFASSGPESSAITAGNGHVDTIVVNSRNEKSTFIDNPPKQRFSQGDQIVVNAPLFRGGMRAGRLDVAGTVTDARNEAIQFTFTATIQGSQITSTGVISGQEGNGFDATVTGGTGRYFGASGEVHVRFTSNTSSMATYHLEK